MKDRVTLGLSAGFFAVILTGFLWTALRAIREERRIALEPRLVAIGPRPWALVEAPPAPDSDLEVQGRLPLEELEGGTSRTPVGDAAPHGEPLELFPLELFVGLEEDWAPTPEGLFAHTTGQWDQEGFVELTDAEARELLPVAEGEIGTFPQTIHALLGGFPTLEDCQRAYESAEVRDAHLRLLKLEVLVTTLSRTPKTRRTQEIRELLETQRAARDATALELFAACERASSYPHWRLAFRLFERWIQ